MTGIGARGAEGAPGRRCWAQLGYLRVRLLVMLRTVHQLERGASRLFFSVPLQHRRGTERHSGREERRRRRRRPAPAACPPTCVCGWFSDCSRSIIGSGSRPSARSLSPYGQHRVNIATGDTGAGGGQSAEDLLHYRARQPGIQGRATVEAGRTTGDTGEDRGELRT